jgi:hypothetical protein
MKFGLLTPSLFLLALIASCVIRSSDLPPQKCVGLKTFDLIPRPGSYFLARHIVECPISHPLLYFSSFSFFQFNSGSIGSRSVPDQETCQIEILNSETANGIKAVLCNNYLPSRFKILSSENFVRFNLHMFYKDGVIQPPSSD